ncbi:MAG: S1 RNA-binding domain-containing protein [Planctomycetes bacterium]|nr:S1 RNA-binding domain-containing protein [Planctomycetota bacterium]
MSDELFPGRSASQEGAVPPPSPETPAPPADLADAATAMRELDREVAEAMASMAPADLAELHGEAMTPALSLQPGAELVGTVVGVSNDGIFLEFDARTQGVVPRSQFGKKEVLDHGRRVDVVVDRFDADSGLLIVNRKGALQRATWTNLTAGMIVEGRVTGVIKGGLEVDLRGIRAFMPASQVDIAPMKDISLLLNQNVRCEVLEVDRRHKNVLLSRRKAQEKERAEAREKLRAELAVGQVRPGVVGNITEYGAFVDLGGVDGLIHIRDLSWSNVEKVSDVLTPGQQVQVKILKIDTERDRLSLGLKQTLPDPWTDVEKRYAEGESLKVRVTRLADFGAFAELEPGVEGLIPLSEMGWSRIRRPADAVSIGAVVDAVVLRVEPAKRRIGLSMKQAQTDPWDGVLETFTAQSLVHGKVTRLADFGAFVELAPGIEGMIHISELADRRVKTCSEVVQPGQEVEARVLGVDKESRRISLSIKQVAVPSAAEAPEPAGAVPATRKPKRKKPLRGGLASHFEW